MPKCRACVYYTFIMMTMAILRCAKSKISEPGEYIEKVLRYKSEEESSEDGSYIPYIQHKVSQTDNGLIASLSMIIVTEIGDRTFLMVAVMAMTHSRALVFSGALASAVIMTVLSALLGFATSIIPRYVTHLTSSVLFAVIGIKMFQEGWSMSPDEAVEEYEEIQEEIKRKADEDVLDVILGGSLGHMLCTCLAVLAGGFVAKKISSRTVTFVGGVIFSLFAATGLFMGPD